MLGFFKKLLGLPTKEEIESARNNANAVPYKIEAPIINNKTGDVVEAFPTAVNDQITDSVTQSPAKKTRKPRVKKQVQSTVEKIKISSFPEDLAKTTVEFVPSPTVVKKTRKTSVKKTEPKLEEKSTKRKATNPVKVAAKKTTRKLK